MMKQATTQTHNFLPQTIYNDLGQLLSSYKDNLNAWKFRLSLEASKLTSDNLLIMQYISN